MSETGKALRIDWVIPEGLTSIFATNVVAQTQGSQFVMSFFEIMQPILLGSEAERASRVASMGSIDARCVARIVMEGSKAVEIMQILAKHVELMKQAEAEQAAQEKAGA